MRKQITKQQLEALSQIKTVHLIDIRSPPEYEHQHIHIARNIPADELPAASEQFSKTDTFVFVCNHGKERSQAAAEYLYNRGFENTFYLEGGTSGWFRPDQYREVFASIP